MSFFTALTGLNAATAQLGVTSNNIANAGTIGFKRSRTDFGDIFATSPLQKATSTIGQGVSLKRVTQEFSQGNVSFSSNTLDLAITGDGFFPLKSADGFQDIYTRNGSFMMNDQYNVVNSAGQRLLAASVDSSGKANMSDMNILTIPQKTTGEAKETTLVKLGLNFPADAQVIAEPFNRNNPATYNKSTALTVYDKGGNGYLATVYYVKTQNASSIKPTNKWQTYVYIGDSMVSASLQQATNESGEKMYVNKYGQQKPESEVSDLLVNAKTKMFSLDDLTDVRTSVPASISGISLSSLYTNADTKIDLSGAKLSDAQKASMTKFMSVSVDGSTPVDLDMSFLYKNNMKLTGSEIAKELTNELNHQFGDERYFDLSSMNPLQPLSLVYKPNAEGVGTDLDIDLSDIVNYSTMKDIPSGNNVHIASQVTVEQLTAILQSKIKDAVIEAPSSSIRVLGPKMTAVDDFKTFTFKTGSSDSVDQAIDIADLDLQNTSLTELASKLQGALNTTSAVRINAPVISEVTDFQSFTYKIGNADAPLQTIDISDLALETTNLTELANKLQDAMNSTKVEIQGPIMANPTDFQTFEYKIGTGVDAPINTIQIADLELSDAADLNELAEKLTVKLNEAQAFNGTISISVVDGNLKITDTSGQKISSAGFTLSDSAPNDARVGDTTIREGFAGAIAVSAAGGNLKILDANGDHFVSAKFNLSATPTANASEGVSVIRNPFPDSINISVVGNNLKILDAQGNTFLKAGFDLSETAAATADAGVTSIRNSTDALNDVAIDIKASYDPFSRGFKFLDTAGSAQLGIRSNVSSNSIFGLTTALQLLDSKGGYSSLVGPNGEFIRPLAEQRYGLKVEFDNVKQNFFISSGTTGDASTIRVTIPSYEFTGAMTEFAKTEKTDAGWVTTYYENSEYSTVKGTATFYTDFSNLDLIPSTASEGYAKTLMGMSNTQEVVQKEDAIRGIASKPASIIGSPVQINVNNNFTVDSTNYKFVVAVDDVKGTVELPFGNTYTLDSFKAELEKRINQLANETGSTVSGVKVGFDRSKNAFTFTTGTATTNSFIKVSGSSTWGLGNIDAGRGSTSTWVKPTQFTENIDGVPVAKYIDEFGNETTSADGFKSLPEWSPIFLDKGELTFDTGGNLVSPKAGSQLDTVYLADGKGALTINIDYSKSTQFSSPYAVLSQSQDGAPEGDLVGVSIGDDGLVNASYSNGSQQALGKVVLVNFSNPSGLRQIGDSSFYGSSASGKAKYGEAGSAGFGTVRSGATERANVDLTQELVDLITAQRNFQANAKAIETSTTLTQTIIQIRA